MSRAACFAALVTLLVSLLPLGTALAASSATPAAPAPASPAPATAWPFTWAPVVEAPPALNQRTAGGIVTVRFSVGHDRGLGIFADGYPRSVRVNCDTRQPVPGSSVYTPPDEFGYSDFARAYSYYWIASEATGNSCRMIKLKLADGSVHQAFFHFDPYRLFEPAAPPAFNRARAGGVVQFRFRLGDLTPDPAELLSAGYPRSRAIDCDTGNFEGPALRTTPLGPGALTHDATGYHYAWQTEPGWAGTCRAFTMRFADSTLEVVRFHFNDNPVARDDAGSAYATNEDNSFTTPNVLANDNDPDGGTVSVSGLDSAATKGSVSGNGDGTFDYDPGNAFQSLAVGERGTDTFRYTIGNGHGGSDSATVTIRIYGRNDAPTNIKLDHSAVLEAQPPNTLVGTLSAVDVDASDAHTFALVGGSGSTDNGLFKIVGDELRTKVTLDRNDAAVRHVRVKADDGHGGSFSRAFNIDVSNVNMAPHSQPQDVSAQEDVTATITLSASDVDDDTLTFSIVNPPSHGSLSNPGAVDCTALNVCTRTIDYTTDPDYNGPDSFSFKASDGLLDSNTATVAITADPVNDAPVAQDTSVSVDKNTSLPIDLTTLVSDVETANSDLTYTIVTPPAHGDYDEGTYTPQQNFSGSDSFSYQVTDRGDPDDCSAAPCDAPKSSATKTVSITVDDVNTPPANSVPEAQQTDEDTALIFSGANGNAITVNDVDLAGGNLTVTLTATDGTLSFGSTSGLSGVTDHAATITGTGSQIDINTALDGLTFTPPPDFDGGVTITLTSDDNGNTGSGGAKTDTDDISVGVNPVNDAPVLDNSKTPVLTSEDEDAGAPSGAVGTLVSDLVDIGGSLDNVSDVDPSPVTGIALTDTDTVHGSWHYSTDGGTSWNPVGSVSAANALLLAANANTRLYFMPDADFNGSVSPAITFRAWDRTSGANGDSSVDTTTNGGTSAFSVATDTADLTINPVNDAPVVDDHTFSVAENSANGTGVGSATFSDVDTGQGHTFSITAGNGTGGGAFAIDGSTGEITVADSTQLDFETTPSFSLTVRVTDDGTPALHGDGTITVNVTDANDAPVVDDLGFSLPENSANGTSVGSATFSDVDTGQGHTFSITAGNGTGSGAFAIDPASGEITVADSTQLDFETAPSFSLTVRVTDDGTPPMHGDGTVTVDLTNVNDAPVNTLPASFGATPDTDSPLTGISVTDQDSAGSDIEVELSVSHGTLTLATGVASGLVAADISGNGTADVTITAAKGRINATLADPSGLVYHSDPAFAGTSDTLVMDTSDLGHTGPGGAQTDHDTATVALDQAPVGTNLNAAESYTEDTPLNLVDIVVSDVDNTTTTATLTLSNTAAGSLTTATSGAVTSTYVPGTGVWMASGAIADVNVLLAGVSFVPAANFNSNFTIGTSVSDGLAPAVTGSKAITGIAVNDAPSATNLNAAEFYTEDITLNLVNIVVSDVDNTTTTAQLTLSLPAAGSLTTATSGSVTSTYVPATGVWTASGAIADVNVLLAGVSFVPAANFNSIFAIATSVSDGIALAVIGSKAITGIAVNDAPVLDASKSPALTAIAEDPGAPSGAVGTPIANLVDFAVPAGQLDNVTDVDAGALLGIAVTAADSTNGTWLYTTNNGAAWQALGSVSDSSARLLSTINARLYFQPSQDFNGTLSSAITFRAWDRSSGTNGGLADTSTNGGTTPFSIATDTASLVVVSIDDAPQATNLSAAESYTEDTPLNLVDIVVSDVDDTTTTAKLTLSNPAAGSLSTATSGSVTSTYVVVTGTWMAAGPIADVNTLLAGVTFTPAANFNSDFTIGTSVSDGNMPAVTGTKAITGIAVNDAPTVTVPAGQTTAEDTAKVFSSGNANLVSVADVDGTGITIQVALSATNGTLTLSGTSGLSFSFSDANGTGTGDGTADAAMTFRGTLTNVNTALAGMSFLPAANFNDTRGAASFAITVNDLGNTGTGGALTDSDSVAISVTAVADAPVALAKSFTVETNMKITGLSGLLTGATDPDTGDAGYTATFTVHEVTETGGTCAGGTVSNVGNATSGSFDYDPPAGQTSSCTLKFRIDDSGSPSSSTSAFQTITINFTGPVIWFVDDSASAGGTGTLTKPFQTIGAADAVDAVNHRIFVFSGSYSQGMTLNNGEWLTGQGAVDATSFDHLMGITPPAGTIARPTVNGTDPTLGGTGITLGSGNNVQGLTFSGTTGTAINATVNVGTLTLADITIGNTSAGGISLTGGGTVTATGANAITTTTATALNVTNTTIGASGITFKSISANGAANGIILNNTGAVGGLTVTGADGADADTLPDTGTGGTIQSTTGDSVSLSSTRSVSLGGLTITASGAGTTANAGASWISATNVNGLALLNVNATTSVNHGVDASTLTNLTIQGGTFTGGGGTNAAASICNFNGFNISNLLGTSSITGATFQNANTINFRVNNSTATSFGGTPDTLTVSGTTWKHPTPPPGGPCTGDHFSANSDTGANFRVIFDNSSGSGSTFVGGGIAVQATAGGTSGKMDAQVSSITSGGSIASGNANTAMAVVAETGGGSITYDIHNNTSLGTGSVAIKVTHASAGGTSTGKIHDNTVTHIAGPGTDALAVDVQGSLGTAGTGTVLIENNTITGNFQRGIKVQAGDSGAVVNATIDNNHLTATDTTGTGLQVFDIESGLSGGAVGLVRLNMFNNTVALGSGATYTASYRLVNRAGCTFQLQDFSGSGASTTDVANWVTASPKSNVTGGLSVGVTATAPFSASAGPIPTPP